MSQADYLIIFSTGYDGTTDVAERVVIIVRFLSKNGRIQHRLLYFKLFDRSLDGPESARILLDFLDLAKNKDKIVAMTRDGAAVNGSACNLSSSSS